jgi:uncharacterized membrane protein YkvA (DUF1232 family)
MARSSRAEASARTARTSAPGGRTPGESVVEVVHDAEPADDTSEASREAAKQAEDFYQRMRTQLRDFAQSKVGKGHAYLEYVLAAPDLLHLCCKLLLDREVKALDKAQLASVVAYYVNPFDFMPELVLGPLGYIDDVAVAAYVLQRLLDQEPEIIARHWAGQENVIRLVQRVVTHADKLLGARAAKRLSRYVKARARA